MNRAWAELKDESIIIRAINVNDDREAVKSFLHDYLIDFTVLLDTYGSASWRWQVQGLPTTFVLSPGGNLIHRLVGKHSWDSDSLL